MRLTQRNDKARDNLVYPQPWMDKALVSMTTCHKLSLWAHTSSKWRKHSVKVNQVFSCVNQTPRAIRTPSFELCGSKLSLKRRSDTPIALYYLLISFSSGANSFSENGRVLWSICLWLFPAVSFNTCWTLCQSAEIQTLSRSSNRSSSACILRSSRKREDGHGRVLIIRKGQTKYVLNLLLAWAKRWERACSKVE